MILNNGIVFQYESTYDAKIDFPQFGHTADFAIGIHRIMATPMGKNHAISRMIGGSLVKKQMFNNATTKDKKTKNA